MWEVSSSLTCLAEDHPTTKYRLLGHPKKVPLGDHLWKRGELVKPMAIPLDFLGKKLYLGDFGLVIQDGTQVDVKIQGPYCFCAPERLHNANPSLASDMWSYMCLFAALYLGANIFGTNSGISTVSSWVDQLGPMPEEWNYCFCWPEEVNDAWYHPRTTTNPKTDLEATIARMRPDISNAERKLALSVMQKAFCYLPERRITAEQLLQDPSFAAIMDIYQC